MSLKTLADLHQQDPAVMDPLRRDLADVLSRHGINAALATPDFMLADLLIAHIRAQSELLRRRQAWFTTGDVAPIGREGA